MTDTQKIVEDLVYYASRLQAASDEDLVPHLRELLKVREMLSDIEFALEDSTAGR